jgi:hypothetical protein
LLPADQHGHTFTPPGQFDGLTRFRLANELGKITPRFCYGLLSPHRDLMYTTMYILARRGARGNNPPPLSLGNNRRTTTAPSPPHDDAGKSSPDDRDPRERAECPEGSMTVLIVDDDANILLTLKLL